VPTSTGSRLADAAQAHRDELERATVAASDEMARSWVTALERIDLEVQTLLSKMEAARLAGIDPSPAWLYQERRLSALLDSITDQAAQWARTAEPAVRDLAYGAAADAARNARNLTTEAARMDLPGVEASFTDLAPENMATILGHLAPGGPLRDLLVSIGAETAMAAQEALLTGVILGKGSDWIGRQLQQALDIPRWRADTIARTEALRAYRETSRETYRKSNVVSKWEWQAALDRRTCPACVAMHGSVFSVEERLDGHPRCRCAMIPVTKTWAELGMDPALDEMNPRVPTETGPEWLKRQPPATQRAVLGPGKYDLYANGKADLPDFVARTHSPEWGTMRRERSLRELAEGRNPDHRDVTPDTPAVPTVPEVPATQSWLDTLPAKPEGLKRRGLDTPENDLRASNPKYHDDIAYRINCTHAVSAHELRRRGYNVSASGLPEHMHGSGGRDLADMYDRWGHPPPRVGDGVSNLTRRQAVETAESFGEGARGAITVVWKDGSGAHIFGWEVRGGKVVFYDPQSGKSLGDAADYFARGRQRVHLIRLDNLTPTDAVKELLA
jgi:SPP1 gp7 family putative phage head morphogenesis protein